MDGLTTVALVILGICLLTAVGLGMIAVRQTRPVNFWQTKLAETLQEIAQTGSIHTRVITSSLDQDSAYVQFLYAVNSGALQPLADLSKMRFHLWPGRGNTVTISQGGRSICVFKITPNSTRTGEDWAEYIVNNITRPARRGCRNGCKTRS